VRRLVRRQAKTDPDHLPSQWHPVVRQVLAARGVSASDELDVGLNRLVRPSVLSDCERAAAFIADALERNDAILFVGDFDTDGATSCALAVRALRAMGADHAEYLVPNRFEYGYGLSPAIASVALAREPALVVTVDNGVSSHQGVALLEDAGVPVVVTDHHLPGDELPRASALVNPNREGDAHPGKSLAGVGVIFHVMLELRSQLRARGWFDRRSEPGMAELLDLVALGTVADVVPLDSTNRILVEQGMRRIRSGRAVAGIDALLRLAGRDRDQLNASDLGFAVAPRLNAAGRLDDMAVGIECLLCDDPAEADRIAQRLDAYNRERRRIETRMRDQAVAAVAQLQQRVGDGAAPAGLCVYSAEWHEGVVGIVAGRVKEHFHRPVVAFAPSGESGELKGSGRSIPGVHMRDLLAAIDTAQPGLIRRFGGHAMAAGLSLAADQFEAFEAAFREAVAERASSETLSGCLYHDGALQADCFTRELATTLRVFVPWGQGFPEPVFRNCFRICERRVVGERHLKFVVKPADSGPKLDAIAFNAMDRGWDSVSDDAILAYRLDVNRYRGRDRLQLVVEHVQDA